MSFRALCGLFVVRGAWGAASWLRVFIGITVCASVKLRVGACLLLVLDRDVVLTFGTNRFLLLLVFAHSCYLY